MRIVAIIQARMDSNRLPGKVMMNIAGKPMIWHIVQRLKNCKKLDDVVIATSDIANDKILIEFAKSNGCKIFTGDAYDVLGRYLKVSSESKADYIVRICADSPLIDPDTVDRIVETHIKSKADYTSNVIEKTFPCGLYAEIFSLAVLEKVESLCKKKNYREHVTNFILEHPEIFILQNVKAKGALKRPDIRLTVDELDDMKLIQEIYSKLYNGNDIIDINDVIDLLNNMPELCKINAHVKQKPTNEFDERYK